MFVVLKAVQQLEDGQIRFRSGQALRAPASPDPDRFAALLQLAEEGVHQRGLAQSGFSGDGDQPALSAFHALELLDQIGHFPLAADQVRVDWRVPRRNFD